MLNPIRPLLAAAAAVVVLASLTLAAPAFAVTSWQDVPGATPDDFIVTPDNYLGQPLQPGFSYTARSSGATDHCAAIDPQGTFPCPTRDYTTLFRIDSSTVSATQATVNLTVTNAAYSRIGFTADSYGNWQQVFNASSHGWMFSAGLSSGTQVGQSSGYSYYCQLGVPCSVTFNLLDRFGAVSGNKLVYVGLLNATGQAMGQVILPLHPVTPSTPPVAAFSASLSGGAAHDWAFDASASTATAPRTVTSYRWDFGDGSTTITTTATTTHTYADGSPHTASLVAVDSGGTASISVSHQLTEPKLIVNSTGDAPATDPTRGCDTGGTVGSPAQPECTLRAAIQSLNAGVGGTKIAFALPAGSTTITTTGALPDITKSGATIDGTEPSGMPVISGSHLHVLAAAGVTITRLAVVGSTDYGIFFDNARDGTVTASRIGVTPDGTVAAPRWGILDYGGGATTIGGDGSAGNVIKGTSSGIILSASSPSRPR